MPTERDEYRRNRVGSEKTPRLVKEYEKIIDEYAEKSYVLDRILNHMPRIENNAEVRANEYGKAE